MQQGYIICSAAFIISPGYNICPAAFINVAGDILYPRDII